MDFLKDTAGFFAVYVLSALLGFILYKIGFFPEIKSLTPLQKRGKAFAIIIACLFLISAALKLVGVPKVVNTLELYQVGYLRKYLGLWEICLAFLIMNRKTYKLGFLLGTVQTGGIMASHLAFEGIFNALPTGIMLITFWLSALYYAPEMFPKYISDIFNRKK